MGISWDCIGTIVGLQWELLNDDKFKYSGNIVGIYWEYNGTVLGMRLNFTDDKDCRRERLWE